MQQEEWIPVYPRLRQQEQEQQQQRVAPPVSPPAMKWGPPAEPDPNPYNSPSIGIANFIKTHIARDETGRNVMQRALDEPITPNQHHSVFQWAGNALKSKFGHHSYNDQGIDEQLLEHELKPDIVTDADRMPPAQMDLPDMFKFAPLSPPALKTGRIQFEIERGGNGRFKKVSLSGAEQISQKMSAVKPIIKANPPKPPPKQKK